MEAHWQWGVLEDLCVELWLQDNAKGDVMLLRGVILHGGLTSRYPLNWL